MLQLEKSLCSSKHPAKAKINKEIIIIIKRIVRRGRPPCPFLVLQSRVTRTGFHQKGA